MFGRQALSKLRDQSGVTLVEQLIAAALIGLLILVWVNSVRVTTKGTVQSKNSLRAQNLGLSKLEDIKALADKASYASTWSSVTLSPLVLAYCTPTIAKFDKKSYTWQVQTTYAYLPVSYTGGSGYATTSTAVAVSWTTSNLLMSARISWDDISGPKVITMTGYATDFRQ
jgi:hypothetical protein